MALMRWQQHQVMIIDIDIFSFFFSPFITDGKQITDFAIFRCVLASLKEGLSLGRYLCMYVCLLVSNAKFSKRDFLGSLFISLQVSSFLFIYLVVSKFLFVSLHVSLYVSLNVSLNVTLHVSLHVSIHLKRTHLLDISWPCFSCISLLS